MGRRERRWKEYTWQQKQKAAEQEELQRLLEAGAPYQADKEATARQLFPEGAVQMRGAGRTGLGERAVQTLGPERAAASADIGARERRGQALDQQKKMEDILNSKQARKFGQIDRFQKTMDGLIKLLGQDDLVPQTKQNVIDAINEFDRTVFDYTGPSRYGIGDDAASVKEKRNTNLLTYFQDNEWKTFTEKPTEGNAARAQAAIVKLKNQKIDVDIYKDAINKRMGEERTGRALLTEKEKKKVLMKPDIAVQIGDIGKKVAAKATATDKAFLRSYKFRAAVMKDVRQANKARWPMIVDKKEREDLYREEADKRAKMVYPGAQFGRVGKTKGWYVKQGDKYVLVAPWSE